VLLAAVNQIHHPITMARTVRSTSLGRGFRNADDPDTQTDEVSAIRKMQQFQPEIPDDETIAYASEPEEEEEKIDAPEPEEAATAKKKPSGRSKAGSPTRPKKK
jgi:hypothetical protein